MSAFKKTKMQDAADFMLVEFVCKKWLQIEGRIAAQFGKCKFDADQFGPSHRHDRHVWRAEV